MFFLSTDVPSKPNDLQAHNINRDSVTLSWQPPTDDGGTDIVGYEIERREQGRSSWTKVATLDGTENSYLVKDLIDGKEYFFRISAKNDIGSSEPAEMEKSVTPKSGFGRLKCCIPVLCLILELLLLHHLGVTSPGIFDKLLPHITEITFD